MLLQTILFPEKNKCNEELYWRNDNNSISYDTYFNMFSIKKWKKYTIVDNVYLELKLLGKCQIKLFADGKCIHEQIENVSEERVIRYQYPVKLNADIIWFQFVALDNGAKIISGEYGTDIPVQSLRNIRIGVNICTYKREEYVKRNVALLETALLKTNNYGLQEHLEIFVVDNGKTLCGAIRQSQKIHVIESRNVGGSGGFTRGLIEILTQKEENAFTHVIFMDDDADIEPESIIRTYALLRLMKSKYANIKIGGAMLRQDYPYIEYAAGEFWNNGRLLNPRCGLDLRNRSNCIENEKELQCEYAGWWFCCMPLTVANETNLPLPMFIHLDDVEYGLRDCNEGFLYLNGICIWHPYFEHRRPSHYEYYEVRNGAIIRLFHSKGSCLKDLKRSLFRRITANVLRYRYDDARLNYMAIEDLCKGISWLAEQDAEQFHLKLVQYGYEFKTIDKLLKEPNAIYEIQKKIEAGKENKLQQQYEIRENIRYPLTYNGWIFPTKKGGMQVFAMGVNPYCFYRIKKLFLYDPTNGKGIVVGKSIKGLITSYRYYWKAARLLERHYYMLEKDYRENGRYLMSIKFWKKYLKLDGE